MKKQDKEEKNRKDDVLAKAKAFFERGQAYESAQREEPYPDVFYVFYRHLFDGIKSRWKGPETALYRKLARSTSYSLVLPLPVITHLRDSIDDRFVTHTRDDHLEVRSSFFTALINEPADTFTRLGLDPQHYHFLDYVTAEDLRVNRTNVQPFPIKYIAPVQNDEIPF